MQKIVSLLMLVVLVVGGWYFVKNFKIDGLDDVRVVSQDGSGGLSPGEPPLPPPEQPDHFIRIATFNIQAFGPSKAGNPQVMGILADLVRQFDVVAVQEIRSEDQTLVERFVQRINASSEVSSARHYRYVLGPRLGRTISKEQYVFLFDSATIEVDRGGVYTVDDPEDVLHREPLVAQFRVRGPAPEHAFTFILVNIHTDPDEAQAEVDALAEVYRVVRQASAGTGVGEDDVILLGDFNAPGRYPLALRDLGILGQVSGIQAAITTEPTNTRRDKLYDNLIFHAPSTVEFTGRAGVESVLRRYNLTSEQELAVSDHLPVWAEFTLFENGRAGRLATQPGDVPR